MKKALILFAVILILMFLSSGVYATDYVEKYMMTDDDEKISVTQFFTEDEEEQDDTDELFDSFFSSLPDEIKNNLPDDADSIGDCDAEKFDSGYVIRLVLGVLKSTIGKLIKPTAVFVALIIICFLIKTVCSGTGCSAAADTVIRIVVCLCAVTSEVLCFGAVKEYLETLSSVAASSIPLCVALMVSTGNVSAAGVSATFTSALSAICENIFARAVLPMCAISAALTAAECVFPESCAVSLSSFVRKASVWVAVITSTLASFIFGVQSLFANAADNVGIKTVKFAVGAMVPFVGGAVGDTVNAVAAGAKYTKTVFGVILLIIISITLSLPLFSIIAGKLSLFVSGAASSILGCKKEADLFSKLSEILNCLLATVVASGAIFAVMIAAFISYGAVL
ncbi:MAG: hypothetical protein IKN38_04965 [Clostridia bacterium]|nr:hypothetical protein [Clostridia bacterium]